MLAGKFRSSRVHEFEATMEILRDVLKPKNSNAGFPTKGGNLVAEAINKSMQAVKQRSQMGKSDFKPGVVNHHGAPHREAGVHMSMILVT